MGCRLEKTMPAMRPQQKWMDPITISVQRRVNLHISERTRGVDDRSALERARGVLRKAGKEGGKEGRMLSSDLLRSRGRKRRLGRTWECIGKGSWGLHSR